MVRKTSFWPAAIGIASALAMAAAPAAAQVRPVDPDKAIDGDLSGSRADPVTVPTSQPAATGAPYTAPTNAPAPAAPAGTFTANTVTTPQNGTTFHKDDLIGAVWAGRIVSDSTLTSRINAARKAIGDSGTKQELIRTIARKGLRFVGEARSTDIEPADATALPPDQIRQPAEAPAGSPLPCSPKSTGNFAASDFAAPPATRIAARVQNRTSCRVFFR